MGIKELLFKDAGSTKAEVDMDAGKVITTQGFNGYSKTRESVASKISAYNAGVRLIADAVAVLPVYKYKINADGSKEKTEDKINYLLNKNCNDYTTAYMSKQMMVSEAINKGNGFLWIVREKGEVTKLVPLTNDECALETNNQGLSWEYKISKYGKEFKAKYYEVINLNLNSKDGVNGVGALEYGASVLGLENSLQLFSGEIMSNGVYSKGVLYAPEAYTPEQRDSIGQKIKGFFSKGNNGKLMVLPDNTKYESLSISPVDLEVLKNREFNVKEIANILKIPPYMIGADVKSGNYATLEQSNLSFLQNTLAPYLVQLEQLFYHYLLSEEEKLSGDYIFKFDTSQLLRTDAKSQADMLNQAVSGGLISVKEARDILDMPYIEGTEHILMSSFNSMVKDGEIINLQSGLNITNPPKPTEEVAPKEEIVEKESTEVVVDEENKEEESIEQ